MAALDSEIVTAQSTEATRETAIEEVFEDSSLYILGVLTVKMTEMLLYSCFNE